MANLIVSVHIFRYYKFRKNTDTNSKMLLGYNGIFPKWNRNSVNSVNLNQNQFKGSASDMCLTALVSYPRVGRFEALSYPKSQYKDVCSRTIKILLLKGS